MNEVRLRWRSYTGMFINVLVIGNPGFAWNSCVIEEMRKCESWASKKGRKLCVWYYVPKSGRLTQAIVACGTSNTTVRQFKFSKWALKQLNPHIFYCFGNVQNDRLANDLIRKTKTARYLTNLRARLVFHRKANLFDGAEHRKTSPDDPFDLGHELYKYVNPLPYYSFITSCQ